MLAYYWTMSMKDVKEKEMNKEKWKDILDKLKELAIAGAFILVGLFIFAQVAAKFAAWLG